MNKQNLIFAAIALLAIGFTSCSDSAPQLPTAYDASTFTANTTNEAELLSHLSRLSSEMKQGDGVNNGTIDPDTLSYYFELANNSVTTSVTSYYSGIVGNNLGNIKRAADDQDAFMINGDSAANGNGGTLGDHLFDAKGLELEQLIEKGIFSAGLYRKAAREYLTAQSTQADLDKALALFGTNPDFPNDGGTLDKYGSNYISDRDAAGSFYTNIKAGFIKAQHGINTSDNALLAEGVEQVKENWEKGLMAQVIYYIYQAVDRVNAASTDEARADALHSWSEAVGFIHGFYEVENKIITDAQIEAVLIKINGDRDGSHDGTAFFGSNAVSELSDATAAIDDIAGIYGFGDPTIFK